MQARHPDGCGRQRPSPFSPKVTAGDAEVLRLALPALGALVAEPLFLLADSAIVGRLGTLPLAGLGIAGAALGAAVSLFVFLAYGTTAGVARSLGAGDVRGALGRGVDGLWLALGLGAVVAVLGTALAPDVVRGLGASPAVEPHAVAYLRWSMPGLPGMLVVLAATGVLRGLQDTRTPLVVAACGAAFNVAASIALVHGLGWGVAGSAVGTAVTQILMAVVLAAVVARAARRAGAPLRPHVGGLARSARVGVPLLVRTLSLRAALLLTTYVAAAQGDSAVAAHQVAMTVWTAASLVLDALAIAAQALVGRALGAGDTAGVRWSVQRMVVWGVGAGVVLGAALALARAPFAAVFTEAGPVRADLVAVLLVVALTLPLGGWVFVLDGVLIGAGDGRYLAVTGAVVLLVYVPMALAVLALTPRGQEGLLWLWAAFAGGFMAVRLLPLALRARGAAWMVTGV
ncbi:putative MATE family efflux protein [Kineococcus xinjiangensis]|uniref:Putative MATE family efflux protein n=1 Tax=Kineococcus xinjiangensis TaxID=512762 RepID=A0A2S6IVA9_9ACTN|nr:MATE family efflux transporter [Kineococcus xinjiangensis]PPK98207.1 putative MATE family efflux protein [Kineococcus xinjiangensis]